MFTPSEEMLYSATRLATFHDGAPLSTGTGFFYVVSLEDGRSTILLVSNQHVFEGCTRIDLSLPIRGADGMPSKNYHGWQLHLNGKPIRHPDPAVDLAAISITDLHRVAPSGEKEFPFYVAVSKNSVPNKDVWDSFDAVEDVLMVGCPNGLFDEVNNLPLIRRGITATHPGRNYQGKPELLVDLACFPGSSGSPVYLYGTGPHFDRKTRGFSIGTIRKYFIGVLYAGPTINQRGEIILGQQPSVSTAGMMHLGIVIKATELLAFDTLVRKSLGLE